MLKPDEYYKMERKKQYNRGYSKGLYDRRASAPSLYPETIDPGDLYASGYVQAYYHKEKHKHSSNKGEATTFSQLTETEANYFYIPTATTDMYSTVVAESTTSSQLTETEANILYIPTATTEINATAVAESIPVGITNKKPTIFIDLYGNVINVIDSTIPRPPAAATVTSTNVVAESSLSSESVNEFVNDVATVSICADYVQFCMEKLVREKRIPSAILDSMTTLNELCELHFPQIRTIVSEEQVSKILPKNPAKQQNDVVILSNDLICAAANQQKSDTENKTDILQSAIIATFSSDDKESLELTNTDMNAEYTNYEFLEQDANEGDIQYGDKSSELNDESMHDPSKTIIVGDWEYTTGAHVIASKVSVNSSPLVPESPIPSPAETYLTDEVLEMLQNAKNDFINMNA